MPKDQHQNLIEAAHRFRRPPDHAPGKALDLIVPMPGDLIEELKRGAGVLVGDMSRYHIWVRRRD